MNEIHWYHIVIGIILIPVGLWVNTKTRNWWRR